jgi:heme oxygenase
VILQELRSRTAPYHESLENRLDLFKRVQSHESYAVILKRFFGFYAPFENTVACRSEWQSARFSFEPRRKVGLLLNDLTYLGISPDEILKLPLCPKDAFPQLETFAQVLGCFDVLEGSTLGGQIISRHFEKTLGMTAESGLSFYHGYGDQTGAMWKEFGAFLSSFVSHHVESAVLAEEIVQSACKTFQSIEDWLCQSS